jgi:hypothetical protein
MQVPAPKDQTAVLADHIVELAQARAAEPKAVPEAAASRESVGV